MLPDNKAGTLLSLCPEDRAKVQRIVQQVMNCFWQSASQHWTNLSS